MSDTAERVKKIVVEHLNVDADKVTDTASFIEDLAPTASTQSNWSWRLKRSSVSKSPMTRPNPL